MRSAIKKFFLKGNSFQKKYFAASTPQTKRPFPYRLMAIFALFTFGGPIILYKMQDATKSYKGDKRGKQLFLRDGRKLAFCEYGSEEGRVIFYLHESGSSRLEVSAFQYLSLGSPPESKNVRIICVDRPGYGQSDPREYESTCDLSEDLIELADK